MATTNEANALAAIPAGRIAAIATFLEMRAPAPARAEAPALPGTIRMVERPAADWYLDLYRRIGADHLWYGRLVLSPARLAELLDHPDIRLLVLEIDGRAEGMAELDFRMGTACEMVYFGVSAHLTGSGQARRLMNRAIPEAFARPIERFFLHTNTLDHPRALDFYRRSGFQPVSQAIEIAEDPRLAGLLPMTAAPHVPVFSPSASRQ
ncbi:GNAT family N-acetyltransferase [Antarcticirhabdus aurantiaca]|uniref:GNAT family N-acetyltransferase n=1 Tax=Antarcticirhabdus aurantiaca TaxID=2606717 RepID=A0ACD4NSY3_9HYPH|nr:GNAT family N-acetyltransferase [Antarcticirhabdus aurantiaca]WAJ29883.1 GNAT family N-acetyltransferase [Jeongeuplla avenae]